MNISVALARSFNELCGAFSLVYDRYLDCGYIDPHPSRMHYGGLQLLDTSLTFIARTHDTLVGTGTIVINSDSGLPSSNTFGDIFSQTSKPANIAEGTMLACTGVDRYRAADISVKLISVGLSHIIGLGVDEYYVVVNPKHLNFWREKVGMEVVSEIRQCNHIKGYPGVLLRLSLKDIREGNIKKSPYLQRILDNSPSFSGNGYKLTEKDISILLSKRPDTVFYNGRK